MLIQHRWVCPKDMEERSDGHGNTRVQSPRGAGGGDYARSSSSSRQQMAARGRSLRSERELGFSSKSTVRLFKSSRRSGGDSKKRSEAASKKTNLLLQEGSSSKIWPAGTLAATRQRGSTLVASHIAAGAALNLRTPEAIMQLATLFGCEFGECWGWWGAGKGAGGGGGERERERERKRERERVKERERDGRPTFRRRVHHG